MISGVMFTNMDGPKYISPVVEWGHLNREITPSLLNHPPPPLPPPYISFPFTPPSPPSLLLPVTP